MTKKTKKPNLILEQDTQAGNEWAGLPDPKEHDCTRFTNEDTDKGTTYCGICGKTLVSKQLFAIYKIIDLPASTTTDDVHVELINDETYTDLAEAIKCCDELQPQYPDTVLVVHGVTPNG